MWYAVEVIFNETRIVGPVVQCRKQCACDTSAPIKLGTGPCGKGGQRQRVVQLIASLSVDDCNNRLWVFHSSYQNVLSDCIQDRLM